MPQRSSRGWTRAAILGLEPCWDRKVCYGSKLSPVSTRGTSRLRYSSQWPSTSYHHFSDKNQKGKIQREGYIGVKKAYYTAKLLLGKDKTTQTYKICLCSIRTEIPNPTSTLKTWPTNGGIERQQKLTSTELQKILDRIRWTNNVHAQLDPPQEPIQPPPNLRKYTERRN